MNIICENCQAKLRLPDEKIPKGKTTILKCPKCKSNVSVNPDSISDDTSLNLPDQEVGFEETEGNSEGYERPFDFVEEDVSTALVCETDSAFLEKIEDVLAFKEYHVIKAKTVREALAGIRFQTFDLIVLNENFDTENPDLNSVLKRLESMDMSVRRKIFVALISDRFRTMDNMTALNKSVNLIINTKDINQFEKILSKEIAARNTFYRIYNEALKASGAV